MRVFLIGCQACPEIKAGIWRYKTIKNTHTMKTYSILFDDGQALILEAETITGLMSLIFLYDYNENGILSITIIK